MVDRLQLSIASILNLYITQPHIESLLSHNKITVSCFDVLTAHAEAEKHGS